MSHYLSRNREVSAEVAEDMCERGFVSVFEHIKPTLDSRTVWVLWLNMSTGEEVLTVIDAQGNKRAYNLVHVFSEEQIDRLVKDSCKLFYDGDSDSGAGGVTLPDLLRHIIRKARS